MLPRIEDVKSMNIAKESAHDFTRESNFPIFTNVPKSMNSRSFVSISS